MPALLFGSIGTIADTSELQREAFNTAFRDHGLDWNWDRAAYQGRLIGSGGAARIAEQAKENGEDVDADAVHRTKSEVFRTLLEARPVQARAGVTETLALARDQGFKVALVTTTAPENVSALLDSLDGIEPGDFDLILDTTQVDAPKPDPAVYALALERLDEPAEAAVAIEDNVGGVEAATNARVAVVAFPGENNAAHDFSAADRVVRRIDFVELASLTTTA